MAVHALKVAMLVTACATSAVVTCSSNIGMGQSTDEQRATPAPMLEMPAARTRRWMVASGTGMRIPDRPSARKPGTMIDADGMPCAASPLMWLRWCE